jgi:Uncharacterized protein conserved in bacteria (DUF2188)
MTMNTINALHVTPEGGSWAVRTEGSAAPSSVHSTQGLAIASAFEMIKHRDRVLVLVHGQDGRLRSSLTIRQVDEDFDEDFDEDLDEAEEAALRAEAMRITPSYDRLRAGIARRLPVEGADLEADPADLY